jgi:hypothetical protein
MLGSMVYRDGSLCGRRCSVHCYRSNVGQPQVVAQRRQIAGMVDAGPDLVPLSSTVLEASSELDGAWAEDRGALCGATDHAEALTRLGVERFGVIADVIHGATVGRGVTQGSPLQCR